MPADGFHPVPVRPAHPAPGYGQPGTPPGLPSYGAPGYGQPNAPGGYGPPNGPGGPGMQGGPGMPGGYGYPGYPQGYGWPGMPMAPQNGMGTAAMVLGILSCCLFCIYGVVSLGLGITAMVLGVKAKKRADRGEATNRGQAQAGFITGIIGTVLGILVIAFLIVAIVLAVKHDNDDTTDSDPFYNSAPSLTAPLRAPGLTPPGQEPPAHAFGPTLPQPVLRPKVTEAAHPSRNRPRAPINANPSRFGPRHRSGSSAAGSSAARPMPHTRSTGLASTRTRSPVPSRYARSSSSAANLWTLPSTTIPNRSRVQISSSKPRTRRPAFLAWDG
jgi:hypothetical protein